MYNVNRVFWTKSLDVNAVYLEKRYCLWSIVYEKVFVLEKMFVLISRSKFSKNQFFVNKCIIETKWLVEIIYVWKNHWHAHLWRNYGFFIHYLKERRGKGKFEIVAIFHLIDHQKKKIRRKTQSLLLTITYLVIILFFLTDFMKTIFRKCFDRFHAKVQEKHVFIWSNISCLVLEKNTYGRKVPSLNDFFF